MLNEQVEKVVTETLRGFKDRYDLEIQTVGYDQNHMHVLCRFLPEYSGGDVIRLIKSITGKQIFQQVPEVKKELWGGEFWTDGYFIATISGRGTKSVIEKYIRDQGRVEDLTQLKLFEF